jgi:hypothetical protein
VVSKTCTFCHTDKPLTEYHRYITGPRAGKIWSQCKDCRKQQLYQWRKANPEKYKKNYARGRLKHKYGLAFNSLDEISAARKGTCPICLKAKDNLVIDHSHQTGAVRGYLCHNCNTLLGHIENPEKMERVHAYLSQEKEATTKATE